MKNKSSKPSPVQQTLSKIDHRRQERDIWTRLEPVLKAADRMRAKSLGAGIGKSLI
jgi:hypothetical protein